MLEQARAPQSAQAWPPTRRDRAAADHGGGCSRGASACRARGARGHDGRVHVVHAGADVARVAVLGQRAQHLVAAARVLNRQHVGVQAVDRLRAPPATVETTPQTLPLHKRRAARSARARARSPSPTLSPARALACPARSWTRPAALACSLAHRTASGRAARLQHAQPAPSLHARHKSACGGAACPPACGPDAARGLSRRGAPRARARTCRMSANSE